MYVLSCVSVEVCVSSICAVTDLVTLAAEAAELSIA